MVSIPLFLLASKIPSETPFEIAFISVYTLARATDKFAIIK